MKANHVRILSPQLPYQVQSVSEGNQRSNTPHCGASAQSLQERPRLCRVAVIGTWLWLLCAGATKVMSESLGLNHESRPCGLRKSRQNLKLARREALARNKMSLHLELMEQN